MLARQGGECPGQDNRKGPIHLVFSTSVFYIVKTTGITSASAALSAMTPSIRADFRRRLPGQHGWRRDARDNYPFGIAFAFAGCHKKSIGAIRQRRYRKADNRPFRILRTFLAAKYRGTRRQLLNGGPPYRDRIIVRTKPFAPNRYRRSRSHRRGRFPHARQRRAVSVYPGTDRNNRYEKSRYQRLYFHIRRHAWG